jgi:excisionase family DNA binding protein
MSSNITVQKVCEFCGQKFTAKTLFTRYCSKQCNSRHYKQLAKEEKAKVLNAQLTTTANSPTETLINTTQDYFEVNEAAQIMRVSTRTLYRLIEQKKLKKKKLLSRTVILREDIKTFFAKQ